MPSIKSYNPFLIFRQMWFYEFLQCHSYRITTGLQPPLLEILACLSFIKACWMIVMHGLKMDLVFNSNSWLQAKWLQPWRNRTKLINNVDASNYLVVINEWYIIRHSSKHATISNHNVSLFSFMVMYYVKLAISCKLEKEWSSCECCN